MIGRALSGLGKALHMRKRGMNTTLTMARVRQTQRPHLPLKRRFESPAKNLPNKSPALKRRKLQTRTKYLEDHVDVVPLNCEPVLDGKHVIKGLESYQTEPDKKVAGSIWFPGPKV